MNYIKGDLLSVKVGVIVHGCNAQSVMASGVAKVLRAKYPDMFTQYQADLSHGVVKLGEVSWHGDGMLKIASAITQEFYGRTNYRYVSYDAIDTAFGDVFRYAARRALGVNLPRIGAGLGNGSWEVISAIISNQAKLNSYPTELINVYEL